MAPSPFRVAASRLRRASPELLPEAGRVPLSALRHALNGEPGASSWLLHPDGVLGRALLLTAGATFTVPLTLAGEARFTTQAMLLPHDWRDGRGAVRASVSISEGSGGERELWAHTLRASDRGRPRGARVQCQLPASTTSLRLRIEVVGALRSGSVGRAIWLEPIIVDPHAPPRSDSPREHEYSTKPKRRSGAPLFSVLTPVHDPPLAMLEEAIASVRAQTFSGWELCLVDDGSRRPDVISSLERYAASDPRIHLKRHDTPGGISAATNAALELARGEYIALLDHDDRLTPDALQTVADIITAQPDLDMVYSDENVVDDRGVVERHPKPGWSPEHMSALMYTCHLGVYRRQLAVDVGGFDTRYDGCQDYDFVLRLMERTDRVAHIPRVLYHWRAHAQSTAGGDQAKPYAYLAQPGAISDHLRRSQIDAQVQFTQLPGIHRVVHRVDISATVDLVLGLTDPSGLQEAAASWRRQPHPSWRVVITAPHHLLDTITAEVRAAGLPDDRVTMVAGDQGQDLASLLATGADAATSAHLLLMQMPAMGLTNDWLTRLLGYSQQAGIAAAGPVVLSANGSIAQAGIALPEGVPLHLSYGKHASVAPPVVYNLSAVSGVLATPRDTYHRIGGLRPEFGDLELIEYCLRATDAGQRTVLVPDARLLALGSAVPNNDLPRMWHLRRAWSEQHSYDPYYNANYRTDLGDFVLARPE